MRDETMVLPQPPERIQEILWKRTKPPPRMSVEPDYPMPYLFNGEVSHLSFRISQIINSPDNYLPLIFGVIEKTNHGSILFIRYRLFFGTRLFLTFWSIVTILGTLYFTIYEGHVKYAVVSLLLGLINYIVTVANFQQRIRKAREILKGLFN